MHPIPLLLRCTVYLGVCAGIVGVIALWQGAQAAGISVHSLADLPQLPAYYSTMRYLPGAQDAEPLLVRFCMPLLEAGASAAGLLLVLKASRKRHIVESAPLLLALLMMLMTGVRSYLLLNLVLFVCSLMAVLCTDGRFFSQLRSIGFWIKSITIGGIGFLFGASFGILRVDAAAQAASQQGFSFDLFLNRLVPVMVDSLAGTIISTVVFDQATQPFVRMYMGAHTFAPVLAWFGLESIRYPPDVYVAGGMSSSNQYSLVGFLLVDFGPYITTMIYIFTGFLSAALVSFLRGGMLWLLPVLIAVLCVLMFNPIGNFFFFTTHVALFLMMLVEWIVLHYLVQDRQKLART